MQVRYIVEDFSIVCQVYLCLLFKIALTFARGPFPLSLPQQPVTTCSQPKSNSYTLSTLNVA